MNLSLPASLLLNPAILIFLLDLAQYIRTHSRLPERHLRQLLLLLYTPAVFHREEPGWNGRETLLGIVVRCIFSEFTCEGSAVQDGLVHM